MVTGGCGFIGSNLIRYLIEREDVAVTNLDLLTYAGNPENLADLDKYPRYRFVHGDVADAAAVREASDGVCAILHLAAESHVDRSIEDASAFVRTNVLGTQVVLDEARRRGVRLVFVSTDEVYGALADEQDAPFTEHSPLAPNSPYAASKAAGDLLARAWVRTYGADVVITRCSNNYGPYQFPEKFLPLMIVRALGGEPLPIYGDGLYRREWLHVEDHCRGLIAAWREGRSGRAYNFGSGDERANLELAELVLRLTAEQVAPTKARITHVADRPGHDRRYAVDASRACEELSWRPTISLEQGLQATVRWYVAHEPWWRRIVAGEHLVDRKTAHSQSPPNERPDRAKS
ncbi:MAG: dTDP-glucose 4,6-dehydratase [Acidobacteriota bacterium]|nr:MAG: dTDP-glucose 4,6-dehydratase [Acidobacteriota bacterium]